MNWWHKFAVSTQISIKKSAWKLIECLKIFITPLTLQNRFSNFFLENAFSNLLFKYTFQISRREKERHESESEWRGKKGGNFSSPSSYRQPVAVDLDENSLLLNRRRKGREKNQFLFNFLIIYWLWPPVKLKDLVIRSFNHENFTVNENENCLSITWIKLIDNNLNW